MDLYDGIEFERKDLRKWVEDSTNWAVTHGIVMRNETHKDLVNFVPFMLFPSPFPKHLYDEAIAVQMDFQRLYQNASKDHEFLSDSLKSVIVHDDFTRRLYYIYDQVHNEGCLPRIHFNITRSDYMINQPDFGTDQAYQLRQIEMNMIAASFAGLGTRVGKLHRFMAAVMGDECPYTEDKLPVCDTISELGAAMALAWQLYGVEDAIVVFVVVQAERNRFDQKLLEYCFYENLSKQGCTKYVPVLFCSLHHLSRNGQLSQDKRFLLDNKEVALFYFRSGYSPHDYNEECWKGRLMVEQSVAVKCPTVAEQLVGTKKVQQVFAAPGMVEKFIQDPEAVHRIRRTFAGLFTLDPGREGDAAVQAALDAPSKFVLKPQREGGGNNMYDDELVEQLNTAKDPVERSQYILMERVLSPTVSNYIIHPRHEEAQLAKTVSELGVFGVFISDGKKEILNSSSGYILRSKSVEHKDGGVAAGRAVLDTPYLI